jgi:hypothetical protein
LDVTFGTESDYRLAENNFVWDPLGPPHPARSISTVVWKIVFVFDDFVFDDRTANFPRTSDFLANFSGAISGSAYFSASTDLTPQLSFSVSWSAFS